MLDSYLQSKQVLRIVMGDGEPHPVIASQIPIPKD